MLLLSRETDHGMSMGLSGAERRRGLRIAQNRPIKVYEHQSARFIGGQTMDVSATGLKIEIPASSPLRVGHVVSVHVGMNEQGQSLANRRPMIPALVVWVARPGESGNSRATAGVEFVSHISAGLDAA